MRKWLMVGLVLLLSHSLVLAQDYELARLRVAHLVWSAAPVDIYVDDELVQPQIPYPFLTPYNSLTAGSHTVTLVAEGENLDNSLLGPIELDLTAGHDYLLAALGHRDDAAWQSVLIDETAALEDQETTATQAALLLLNGLQGAEGINGLIDGEPVITDLGYGEYVIAPLDLGWRTAQFTIADTEQTTLFDVGPGTFFGTPYTLVIAAAVGTWPGEMFLNNSVEIWPGLAASDAIAYLRAITDAGNDGIEPFTALGAFDELLAALERADLLDLLASDGPWTLYAPINAAFVDANLPDDPDRLADLLRGHIVASTQLPMPGEPVTSLNGHRITVFFSEDAPPLINDVATFTGQMFSVGNGQIVVIDAILPRLE